MKENHRIVPVVILLKGGPLVNDFKKEGRVLVWKGDEKNNDKDFRKVVNRLKGKVRTLRNKSILKAELKTCSMVYLNTVAGIRFFNSHFEFFKDIKKVLHVHEMGFTIKKFVPDELAHRFHSFDKIIVVNKAIEAYFLDYGIGPVRILRVTEYLDAISKPVASSKIDSDRFHVISVGLGSWRKGIDLFIQTAYFFSKLYDKPFQFTWVGNVPAQTLMQLRYEIKQYGLTDLIHFSGEVNDTSIFFSKCDVFYLSSREDSYPLVMLEATLHGKPVIYFSGSGGASEFINDKEQEAAPLDIQDAAQKLLNIAKNYASAVQKAIKLREKIDAHAVEIVGQRIFEFITDQ
jgi:glycosyltransferase involved in cell wall biosynthesis